MHETRASNSRLADESTRSPLKIAGETGKLGVPFKPVAQFVDQHFIPDINELPPFE